MVGASTYKIRHRSHNDSVAIAQLGVVPLTRLIDSVVAPTIDVVVLVPSWEATPFSRAELYWHLHEQWFFNGKLRMMYD